MAQTYFDDPRKLKIKDFVITDEFEKIDIGQTLKEACNMLVSMNCGVLLVKEGEKDIKGVITERKILKKIAGSDEPMTLKVGDIMDTHILKIHYDEKLTSALESIEAEKPAAVIVVDKNEAFKGYFSPIDFIQAEKMLKGIKKRMKDKAETMSAEDEGSGE